MPSHSASAFKLSPRPDFRVGWNLGAAAIAAVLLTLAQACSGSGGGAPATQAGSGAPQVSSLAVNNAIITQGGSATLSFAFQGGTGTFSPDLGPVTSGQAITVSPTTTTTYTLTVQGSGTAVDRQTITVQVVPPPSAATVQAPAQAAPGQSGLLAMVAPQPGSTYSWTITNGNGTISSGPASNACTFSANAAGTVDLQCIVTNAAGTAGTPATASVTVAASAIAAFQATPAIITSGSSTTLVGTFTGTGTINPGNFTVASGANLTVAPTVPTIYTLSVPGAPAATAQVLVNVLPVPAAAPITGPGAVVSGLSYQAQVPEQAGCSYQWTVSNGTATAGATTRQITFTAGAAGSNLTLDCTVTNQAGASTAVSIVPLPIQAAAAAGAPVVILAAATVPAFQAGVLAEVPPVIGATYQWTLPTGAAITAGANTNAITFTAGPASGTVTCALTLPGGGTQTASATLTTTVPVISSFTAASASVTAGKNTNLNFVFSGGTGIITPGPIAVTSPGAVSVPAGTYTLTVTDPANNTAHQSVTVNPVPLPTIASFTAADPIIGPGGETDLLASFNSGGGTAVVDGNVGAVTSGLPKASGPLNSGTTFTLRVTNAGGDAVTSQVAVRVATLQVLAGIPAGSGNGDGPGAFARFRAPGGIVLDPGTAGQVYVADSGNHTIRKVAPDGTTTTLAGNPGVAGFTDGVGLAAAFSSPKALAVDGNSNLYVADTGNHAIRMVAPDGTVTTLAGDGTAGADDGTGPGGLIRFNSPKGIAVNPAGTQLFVSDSGNFAIRSFDPTAAAPTTTVIAGQSGVQGPLGGQLPILAATFPWFQDPRGIALDPDGSSLYVADRAYRVLFLLTQNAGGVYSVKKLDGVYPTIAGAPAPALVDFTVNGGPPATYGLPTFVAVDSSSNLYVTDDQWPILRKLTISRGGSLAASAWQARTLAGNAGTRGNAVGDPLAQTLFVSPTGVAVPSGPTGLIYMADSQLVNAAGVVTNRGNTIRVVSTTASSSVLAGAVVQTGLVNGPGYSPANFAAFAAGTGPLGLFNTPRSSAVDPVTGNLYVADSANNCIRMLDPTGNSITVAGTGVAGAQNGPGTLAGPGIPATFNGPRDLVFDAQGNLYVADTGNNLIRMIAAAAADPARTVSTIAGTGVAGYTPPPTANLAAQFNQPAGLALDAAGNLLVADRMNHVIRKVDLTAGQVTTVAGDPTRNYMLDGPFAVGALSQPYGIALDPTKANLIVSDANLNTIRVVSLADGTLGTLAGANPNIATVTIPPGFVDGPGVDALFNGPTDLAVDPAGNVYVADYINDAIRMIDPGGVVHTLLGQPGRRGVTPGSLPMPFADPQGVSLDAAGNLYISTPNAVMKMVFQ